jgi:hypothetical protein
VVDLVADVIVDVVAVVHSSSSVDLPNTPVKRDTGAKAEISGAFSSAVRGSSPWLLLTRWLDSKLRSELTTRDLESVCFQNAEREGAHETMTVV